VFKSIEAKLVKAKFCFNHKAVSTSVVEYTSKLSLAVVIFAKSDRLLVDTKSQAQVQSAQSSILNS